MKFISTRGDSERVDAAYAIKTGLARDGGLFMPESIPTLTSEGISALLEMTYPERAAEIIKGRRVAKNVRAIIIPATQDIYLKAMENGLLKIFIEAGCVVSTPTCGPCLGGYMGILAAGERAVATTNRNFIGRMGDVTSEVYLASPAVAAASAIAGKIADPKEIVKE